jgi:hypothetical protein
MVGCAGPWQSMHEVSPERSLGWSSFGCPSVFWNFWDAA